MPNVADTDYANRMLEAAKSMYDFGKANQGTYTNSVPNVNRFYGYVFCWFHISFKLLFFRQVAGVRSDQLEREKKNPKRAYRRRRGFGHVKIKRGVVLIKSGQEGRGLIVSRRERAWVLSSQG